MGVNVRLYVEAEPTPGFLAEAEAFFVARSNIADTDERFPNALVAKDDEQSRPRVEVRTFSRYYGPRSERGNWPEIYGAIRVLQAAFPGHTVFYGTDSSEDGTECTQEYLAELWQHFLARPEGS